MGALDTSLLVHLIVRDDVSPVEAAENFASGAPGFRM
jgi:hypothetical protein